ncbi:MAG: prepilin-type N-terminal cleavage/methylation domain-containing protein [Synergistaceae bacterium]|jgi:prepilin-type N-terminal cleavage/methylation domain-containing protein|nr:prepilin-type N-terminal cleavage/methylation domain-containing protein [Synergistaceae bacterium]
MRGFTLIETLVSLLVLALVVTASLKLVALSQRGLAEVREKEAMLNAAGKLQIEIASDPLNIFGVSRDVAWSVHEMSSPLWIDEAIDIRALAFGQNMSRDLALLKGREQKWRELDLTRNGRTLTLFLPPASEMPSQPASSDAQ